MSAKLARRLWLKLGPATRLAVGLVTLMVAALILSEFFVTGFLPNPAEDARRHRSLVSRLAAAQLLEPLQKDQVTAIREVLSGLMTQTPDLLSIAVASPGREAVIAGDHRQHWQLSPGSPSSIDQISVPVLAQGQAWGEVQLAFKPALPPSLGGLLRHPTILGVGVMVLLAFVCFQLYLRRAMRYLDPAAAVPDRVRSAFDTLIEGILVIDRIGNVMLANAALARMRPDAGPDLVGRHIDSLVWLSAHFREQKRTPPWQKVLAGKGPSLGHQIRIDSGHGGVRTVILNCSAVDNGQDRVQGCLLTLSDITELEERTHKLRQALHDLNESQAEIVAKNAELTWLATRDALTATLNRRTLMVEAEASFARSRAIGQPLVCLMCDIDHFKSINDRFGHAAGDRVIEAAARELDQAVGERGLVGRYGGEEFCIILTGLTLEQGLHMAEYARAAVEANVRGAVSDDAAPLVTMSFGAATLDPTVASTADLIDRADQALYYAKRHGRNRVTAWQPRHGSAEVRDGPPTVPAPIETVDERAH